MVKRLAAYKAEHEGFSHNIPQEVYFGGNKMN